MSNQTKISKICHVCILAKANMANIANLRANMANMANMLANMANILTNIANIGKHDSKNGKNGFLHNKILHIQYPTTCPTSDLYLTAVVSRVQPGQNLSDSYPRSNSISFVCHGKHISS